jgi:broad specificity phosphatase PhoE
MAATRYGLTWRPVATLGEVDRRAYVAPDQATYEAAVAAFFARPEASPYGWETAAAALSRFRTALEGLLARHAPEESLAVVSHGLVLSLYEAHLRGEPPSLERWRALPFCAIAAVERALLKPVTGFLPAPYAGLPVPESA